MYCCETVWLKVLVSKGWLQSEIAVCQYKHYNGKNKQRGKEGGFEGREGCGIFGGKKKKLENFSGIAHSVLISLGHFELHFCLCQPQTNKTTVV